MRMRTFRRNALLFFCDTGLLAIIAVALSWYFKKYGLSDATRGGELAGHLLLLLFCTFVFQLLFHNYDSLWRYAESREYLFLLMAAFCGFVAYEVFSRVFFRDSVLSFILLTAIVSTWVLAMLLVRFIYRYYPGKARKAAHNAIPVAIVGAGSAAIQLLYALEMSTTNRYDVKCFFDDDPEKQHQRIHSIEVKGRIDDIPEMIKAMRINLVIVAIPSLGEARRQEILRMLAELENVRVLVLPNTLNFMEDKPIRAQLREVRIEDLLGRPPVALDLNSVATTLNNKVVLVTGGGGSIGSELCRQIAKYQPRELIILDIYENNAYDIQQELRRRYGFTLNFSVEIASIRDRERIWQVFDKYRPDIVFHAAAHKHVPLMEKCPQEAVRNNVFGTLNLVQAANSFSVAKFIQVSTDKAVNPTSVMGASKRMCEIILQSMKNRSDTCFAAVRFGNVLGSNGSVVPLFEQQIAQGGPITITDKRIIRYFMTIPEAAQLVLQAGAMAKKNELYVLDMGEPVKILNLAENLIRLSGLTPYKDIEIKEVGLRPGEKLYEELLVVDRDIGKTENNKIFVEQQPDVSLEELEEKLEILKIALEEDNPAAIRVALHRVVPNFYEPEELNLKAAVRNCDESKELVTAGAD